MYILVELCQRLRVEFATGKLGLLEDLYPGSVRPMESLEDFMGVSSVVLVVSERSALEGLILRSLRGS